ncbi:tRNA1(Val) (adenine(37)-N6)-methyltransferase [Tranquillimonas rosea]|uniref:tRNA1(Val) (adenine(37)-N6)-methyltransferase n=1 Tax=Tranquillimonas rosea TaxID=641238 RepID=UPI003BA9E0F9
MSGAALTADAFLGGRLTVRQPARGFRAGVDAVMLAAAVPARSGDTVLELGCGVGTASLCLARRVAGLDVTGIEREADYATLARENAAGNAIGMSIFTADLSRLPDPVRVQSFDHVIANPPYYVPDTRTGAADAGREAALAEDIDLRTWIDVATRRLAPGGWLTLIQRADRLRDVLAACDDRLGALEVLPLAPRHGRAARLVLLRARKGGRSPMVLHAPVVLHEGDRHERDGESYAAEIAGVLRDALPMPWPGR